MSIRVFSSFYFAFKGFLKRFPFVSFVISLVVLLGLIVLGNALRSPKGTEGESGASVLAVSVVTGDTPKYADMSGIVESGRTVTVRASVAGIVERIDVAEGDRVGADRVLVVLADTYDGSAGAFVAEDIAERGVSYQDESYWKRDSLAEYQSDDVARTDTFEENIARKQYSIARDGYAYERDLADLELDRARTAASLYLPKTPVSGTVERLFVVPGDRVNPGDALAIVSGQAEYTKIVVSVGESVARVARTDIPTHFRLRDGSTVEAVPAYRSLVPTDGHSYSLTYIIEEPIDASEGEYLSGALPLSDTTSGRLVPLSAVYVGSDGASVFVNVEGQARHRTVILGEVVGSYVVITGGLETDDMIITDRSVSDGDSISILE